MRAGRRLEGIGYESHRDSQLGGRPISTRHDGDPRSLGTPRGGGVPNKKEMSRDTYVWERRDVVSTGVCRVAHRTSSWILREEACQLGVGRGSGPLVRRVERQRLGFRRRSLAAGNC